MSLSTCDVSTFRQRCNANIENLFGFPLESLNEKENLLINNTGVLPLPKPVKGVVLSKFLKGIFNLIASPAERIVLGAPVSITDSKWPKDRGYIEIIGKITLLAF